MPGQTLLDTSTDTPLGISGVYTGGAVNVQNYSRIVVQAYSDKASAASGCSMQFSTDRTNWDNVAAAVTVSAATVDITVLAVTAEWFRIVYSNSTAAQTEFRLSAVGHDGGEVPAALVL